MTRFIIVAMLVLLQACASERATVTPAQSESNQRERARIHTELGAGYFAQNQLAVALDEFSTAVKLDPAYSMAYNGLGLVYAALKEDVKADESFKKSLSLDAHSSEAHNNYGSFLCSRNRIDESITQFLEAVKNPLYTTPSIAYMNAGLCSLRKPDIKDAELYFRQALQLDPLLHPAAYQLGMIYYNSQKYLLAREALQNAVVDNPSADILWLGIMVERKLGDENAESSYGLELRRKYPDSEQAKALLLGR